MSYHNVSSEGDQDFASVLRTVNNDDVPELKGEESSRKLHSSRGGFSPLIIVAILINTIIVAILVTVVFVPFELSSVGQLSTREKSIYVTGLTILATLCASFSSSRMRYLWLKKVDIQIASDVDLVVVNPVWRTALAISTLAESCQQWDTSLSFLISSLITTALVAGLTPSNAERNVDYLYYLADSQDYLCTSTTPPGASPASLFNWILPNGSYFSVAPNTDFCPDSLVMTLMGTINNVDPANYGYADEGVAIHRSALGAPASIYTSRTNNLLGSSVDLNLNNTLNIYGQNLLSTSQCVPVMTSNPISCKMAGNVTYTSSGYLEMWSDDRKCSIGSYVGVNASWNDVPTVATLCTEGSLGQATIVIGSYMSGAIYMAESMGDAEWLDKYDPSSVGNTGTQTYGVVCTVDVAPTVQYRNLTLTLESSSDTPDAYSRSLTADNLQSCQPDPLSMSFDSNLNKLIALAAAGTWQPLYYGWTWPTRQLTILPGQKPSHDQNIRSPPYAFENSASALEDVLGLASALALSRASTTGGSGQTAYIGSATIRYTRAGTGEKWALVYVLPSLLVALILICLAVTSRLTTSLSSSQLVDLASLRSGTIS